MTANPTAVAPAAKRELGFFSPDQWRALHNEDSAALGSVSLLLMSIVAAGMLGMATVVGILAFL